MGWHPESGLIPANWVGFNEGMFVNILALGSATHPGPADLWQQWTAPYPRFWRGEGPTRRIAFAPLFPGQYSQIFIDFRGIRDAVMRNAGFDYFENSRRETYANRAWCIANPMGWDGYSRDVWGLSACDGPGDLPLPFKGRTALFYGYSARGPANEPDGMDDGTISPVSALGCLPFAPEIVIPCAGALRRQPGVFDRYGFKDSFNPSFTFGDPKVDTGSVDPRFGWVAEDYLGIVSDRVVEIPGPAITGGGDLEIDAAIYAGRRFVVTDIDRGRTSTLRIYGSLAAGTISATEPRYATKIDYDTRFERQRPPGFPSTNRYEVANWDGQWTQR